jgi:hypothetical protein
MIMTVRSLFLYAFAVLFLLSCRRASENIVYLQPSQVVKELNDSTFFMDVYCITHDLRSVYASDTYHGCVLKFDREMNGTGRIGVRGQGPEELACPGGVACLNDSLYVIECVGLKVFTADGNFVRSEKNETVSHIDPFLFCMDESGFYVCSTVDTFPLVKYDTRMNRQFGFGIRQGEADEKISGNQYMLQLFEDKILSIKRDEPSVTLYTREGDVLLNRRIDSRIFNSRLLFRKEEREKDPANRKKTYSLFGSLATSGKDVYLLYTHHNSENRPFANRIARFRFADNDFRLVRVYELPDVWYLSMCLVENRLVCYSKTNEEFQLYGL